MKQPVGTMSPELFSRYNKDPLGMESEVRRVFSIPEDFYFTVSMWPHPGVVAIDESRLRTVPMKKISKSP